MTHREHVGKGFSCTRCGAPTYVMPDFSGLPISVVFALCENWKCDDCLKLAEEELSQS